MKRLVRCSVPSPNSSKHSHRHRVARSLHLDPILLGILGKNQNAFTELPVPLPVLVEVNSKHTSIDRCRRRRSRRADGTLDEAWEATERRWRGGGPKQRCRAITGFLRARSNCNICHSPRKNSATIWQRLDRAITDADRSR